jgi:hypothetical protein
VIVPDTCPRPDGDHQDLERAPQRFEGRVYESLVKGDGNLVIVDETGVYLSDGGSTEISIPAPEVAFVTRGRGACCA